MPSRYDFSALKLYESPAERVDALPTSIQELIQRAISEVNPLRIYLFGSRVRGDFHETSDIDIGFELDEHSVRWSNFAVTESERARTLLSLDLVNFSNTHISLRDYIASHGVLVYER